MKKADEYVFFCGHTGLFCGYIETFGGNVGHVFGCHGLFREI